MEKNRPEEWGVPHDRWRPQQFESVLWAVHEVKGCGLLDASTGSGKTATATAIASRSRALSVCSTKNLQDQYLDGYGWTVMKGKGNYPCLHPHNDEGATAEDCLFSPMGECELVRRGDGTEWEDEHAELDEVECPYYVALVEALGSSKLNINYHLWFMAKMALKLNRFNYVIADEAHLIPELSLDFSGVSIGMRRVMDWGLSPPPRIPGGSRAVSFSKVKDPTPDAIGWLLSCAEIMDDNIRSMGKPSSLKGKAKLRAAVRFMDKLNTTAAFLQSDNTDWYIASGQGALGGESGFVAKPLTARYVFPKLSGLNGSHPGMKLMLMSATIGNPEVLAAELGIKEFEYRSVPSVWDPEVRPVDILDVPGMGATTLRKDPGAVEKQADEIARYIKKFPGDWPGLVLVSRISEATEMAKRLGKRGLGGRVFPLPTGSTTYQLEKWEERKRKVKGSIGISWSFWEGFDGVEEKIMVIGKVPFPPLGSRGSYERERCEYDANYYRQRAALGVEQGAGRVRRGNKEDYNVGGVVRSAVAVADGNIGMVKRYLSDSFVESMRKEEKGGV